MFCHQCGTENSDTAKFCKNCGTQLQEEHIQEEPIQAIKTEPEIIVNTPQEVHKENEETPVSQHSAQSHKQSPETSNGSQKVMAWAIFGIIFVVGVIMFNYPRMKEESSDIYETEINTSVPSRDQVIALADQADKESLMEMFTSGEFQMDKSEGTEVLNDLNDKFENINHQISDFKEVSADQISPKLQSYTNSTNKVYEAVVTADAKVKKSFTSYPSFVGAAGGENITENDKKAIRVQMFSYFIYFMMSELAKGTDFNNINPQSVFQTKETLSFTAGQIIKMPHKEGEDRYQFVKDSAGQWRCEYIKSNK